MWARGIALAAATVVAGLPLLRRPTVDPSSQPELGTSAVAVGRSRAGPDPPAASLGTYAWPVSGEVIRPFVAPDGPYGAGHRGIDIATARGARVVSASDGVVAFAGTVAGALHVSIDHPDGVRTSYAYLSRVDVREGEAVVRGQAVGQAGDGHVGVSPAHLHFGARYAGAYIDPMFLLERRDVVGLIHLAPLEDEPPSGSAGHEPGGAAAEG